MDRISVFFGGKLYHYIFYSLYTFYRSPFPRTLSFPYFYLDLSLGFCVLVFSLTLSYFPCNWLPTGFHFQGADRKMRERRRWGVKYFLELSIA
jgi:hypothetical protein